MIPATILFVNRKMARKDEVFQILTSLLFSLLRQAPYKYMISEKKGKSIIALGLRVQLYKRTHHFSSFLFMKCILCRDVQNRKLSGSKEQHITFALKSIYDISDKSKEVISLKIINAGF